MKTVVYAGSSHRREIALGSLLDLDEGDERYDEVLCWDVDTPALDLDDDVAEALVAKTSKREWVVDDASSQGDDSDKRPIESQDPGNSPDD